MVRNLLLVIVSITLISAVAMAQTGRPIVYVHGYCGSGSEWVDVHSALSAYLMENHSDLYKNITENATPYLVWFDNSKVNFSQNGLPVDPNTVSADARFFAIQFFDPRPTSDGKRMDNNHVADVPIVTKGNELAQILEAIRNITHVRDVIVIGHSMGGLVTRVYFEGLAAIPVLNNNSDQVDYSPGTSPYNNDIGALITLDTPHSGTMFGNWPTVLPQCFARDHLNRREMSDTARTDTPFIVGAINYSPGVDIFGHTATDLPPNIVIRSLYSYDTDPDPNTDTVLGPDTQDVTKAIPASKITTQSVGSLKNFYHFRPVTPFVDCNFALHLLGCLGSQGQTQALLHFSLDGTDDFGVKYFASVLEGDLITPSINVPTQFDIGNQPVGVESVTTTVIVSNIGDSDLQINSVDILGKDQAPSSEFRLKANTCIGAPVQNSKSCNINFTFTPSDLGTRSATLVIQDNAPGSPHSSLFLGTGVQGGTNKLASPTIISPVAGSTGQSANLTLIWSGVAGATSYRVMIAPNQNSLPTDRFARLCSGCAFDDTSRGTTFLSVPDGKLVSGTTYFWQVKAFNAASSTQDSDWAGPLSFTTAQAGSPLSINTNILVNASLNSSYSLQLGASGGTPPYSWSSLPDPPVSGMTLNSLGLFFGAPTKIGSFTFTARVQDAAGTIVSKNLILTVNSTVANDFRLSFSGSTSQQVLAGHSAIYNINTATTSGTPQALSFSAVGLPPQTTFNFQPSTINSDASTVLTLTTNPLTSLGNYNIGILASNSAGLTHQISGLLNVTENSVTLPVLTGFDLSLNPAPANSAITATVSLSAQAPTDGAIISLGVTNGNNLAVLMPSTISIPGSSSSASFTINTQSVLQQTTVTIAAAYNNSQKSVDLKINPATSSSNFSVSASPPSQTSVAGAASVYGINTFPFVGSKTLQLTVTGLPTGASGQFSEPSVTEGNGSLLTLTTSQSTPAGTYTITITASDGLTSQATNVTLVVVPFSGQCTDYTVISSFSPLNEVTWIGLNNGKVVVPFSTGTAKASVVDIASNSISDPIPLANNTDVGKVAFIGNKAYIPLQDLSNIAVLDLSSNSVSDFISLGSIRPFGIAADNGKLYITGINGGFMAVDSDTKAVSPISGLGAHLSDVTIVPWLHRGYVLNHSPASVAVVDLTSNTIITTVNLAIDPFSAAVVAGNVYIAGRNPSDESSQLVILNPIDNSVSLPIALGDFFATGIGGFGNRVFVTNTHSTASSLTILDTKANSILKSVSTGVNPVGIVADPQTRLIFVGNESIPGVVSELCVPAASTTDTTISVLPSALTFPLQPVHSNSGTQNVSITNQSSSSTIQIYGIAAQGDFTAASGCTGGLDPGSTCTIPVSFSPTRGGTRSGTLVVFTNAFNSPNTVQLLGQGGGPNVQFSSSSIDFGQLQVGSSATGQLLLSNTGTAPLLIGGVTASASDFVQINKCSRSIVPGDACQINVTFSPHSIVTQQEKLTIFDNAADGPHTIALSGSGTGPILFPSVTALEFSSQFLGAASSEQQVIIRNSGNQTLSISSVSVAGGFTAKSDCIGALSPLGSCTARVTFQTNQLGLNIGAITFTDNAADSPQSVGLTGTGMDLVLTPAQGSSTALTVTAGQTANYNLILTSRGGFSGAVTLACSGAPQASTCTVSPQQLQLSSSSPIAVTISTTARSQASVPVTEKFGGLQPIALVGILGVCIFGLYFIHLRGIERNRGLATVFLLSALLLILSCGGGGRTPPPSGTPQGSFPVTVSVTSGSVTRNFILTLNVN